MLLPSKCMKPNMLSGFVRRKEGPDEPGRYRDVLCKWCVFPQIWAEASNTEGECFRYALVLRLGCNQLSLCLLDWVRVPLGEHRLIISKQNGISFFWQMKKAIPATKKRYIPLRNWILRHCPNMNAKVCVSVCVLNLWSAEWFFRKLVSDFSENSPSGELFNNCLNFLLFT